MLDTLHVPKRHSGREADQEDIRRTIFSRRRRVVMTINDGDSTANETRMHGDNVGGLNVEADESLPMGTRKIHLGWQALEQAHGPL